METLKDVRLGLKKTKIGWIPMSWKWKRLRSFAEVITGSTPSTRNKSNYGNEYCLVSPSDLGKKKYIRTSSKMLSASGYENSRKMAAGSVLFTCIGSTIGKIGISQIELTSNQQINAVLPNENYSSEFMYYELQRWAPKIKYLASEQAVPMINKSEFEAFQVCFPPLPEQKKIAQILSTWDEAISDTQALIAQLKLRKKGLMQQLLTGKKRLKGFDGEWEKLKARDFLIPRKEHAINDGQIPLYSLTIAMGITPKTDRYVREFLVKDTNKKYKLIYPNDLAFNPSNLRWGAIAVHHESEKVIVSPIYEVLSLKEGFDLYFIENLLCSSRQIAIYSTKVEGTLIERMAVKLDTFLLLDYFIPPIEEQKAIGGVLETASVEIRNEESKLEQLQAMKKGLMQQLLTGQKRVKLN